LHAAYAQKGFELVVISPHQVSDLREQLIGQYKAKYWIGCDSKLRTLIQFVVPNVVAEFPMTYLVDARGKVTDHGDALEAKIEYLLEELFEPELGRALHAALKAACRSYAGGAIGAAWQAAGLLGEGEDAVLVADAKFLRTRCEAYSAWRKLMLEREIGAGDLPAAVRHLKKMEKAFRGMPAAAWAARTRGELETDPKVKMESVLGGEFDFKLKHGLHAGLKSASRHYDRDAIGVAWKAAAGKLGDDDARLVEDAAYLRERCEAYGERTHYLLQREIDKGAYPTVVPRLKEMAKTFKGMPAAAWASTTRRQLEKDPKVRNELKAWARLEKALAKSEKARGSPKKRRAVRKEYQAIVDAYPGTLAAREAGRQLER
jgi:hypothetical protein